MVYIFDRELPLYFLKRKNIQLLKTIFDFEFLRYVDIFLGILLLCAQLCLLHGSHQRNRLTLIIFLSLSLTTISLYWVWFAYLKYALQDTEATEEVVKSNIVSRVNLSMSCRFLMLGVLWVSSIWFFTYPSLCCTRVPSVTTLKQSSTTPCSS